MSPRALKDRAPILPPGRADAELLSSQIERVSQLATLSLLSDFPVALLVLNGNRQIVYCNDRAFGLMGPAPDVPFGLRPGEAFSCVHSKDGLDGCGTGPFCRYCGSARSLAAVLAGMLEVSECTIERSRTERLDQLDLLVWTKPLAASGETFFLFSVIDISERKRRESLERVFLHDLMNTAGSLSSLMRLIDPREDTFTEYLSLAKDASDQLVDEIASQRMLSEAERGALAASFATVPAAEIGVSLAEIYRRIAETRGVALRFTQPKAVIPLRTDPVLLRRVLSNLLKNAVEASVQGQTVTLSLEKPDGSVEFSVSNPAVLPEEVLAQLFHRSFSTKGRGRGLGTYAARLFTEDYLGGSIGVRSEGGKGTTFTVRLPDPRP